MNEFTLILFISAAREPTVGGRGEQEGGQNPGGAARRRHALRQPRRRQLPGQHHIARSEVRITFLTPTKNRTQI